MPTRRERMEARADRLDGWAAKRDEKAGALRQQDAHYRGDHAFNTQPGHIPERARVIARGQRAFDHTQKAGSMRGRAAGLRSATAGAIYSDDDDARERLEERIAGLETQRERMKAANADYRKAHRAELQPLTKYQRDELIPHPGYAMTNLGANIRRNRERLAALDAPPVIRTIAARRDGDCEACAERIAAGELISKVGGVWVHQRHAPPPA